MYNTLRYLLVGSVLILCGCNPGYLLRGAYEQSKILIHRQDISKLLTRPPEQEPDTDTRSKLHLIQDALSFGESKLGLATGKAYRTYSHTDRDPLAWVLLAAQPDSLTPYEWWFPIVGSVPYKGFFTKQSAEDAAAQLRNRGFETWIRGTVAFSTLGWFEDPVVTPMLKAEPHSVVNTILHECFHRTLWIPGSVSFNERAANFVGLQGAVEFYRSRVAANPSDQIQLTKAEETLAFYKELSAVFTPLVTELKALFASAVSREEKILQRAAIYEKYLAPLRAKYPKISILKTPNNAELMQHALYLTDLAEFQSLFEKCNQSWACFQAELKKLEHST